MVKPIKYFDINEWERLTEINTLGTRNKFIVLNPETNESFFFKTSLHKEVKGRIKSYPFEFWSEIVSSILGEMLHLPVLHYDIASFKNSLGCISKNMASSDEEMTEGYLVITQFFPKFLDSPDYKKSHTLNLIHTCLARLGFLQFKRIAIEMLLFDCIIGNTDRHSQNWALIKHNSKEWNSIREAFNRKLTFNDFLSFIAHPSLFFSWKSFLRKRNEVVNFLHKETGQPKSELRKILKSSIYKFAPFYDNGSSLGRELDDDRILEMIEPESIKFNKYFKNGFPDIRVRDRKTSFLETIEVLIEDFPKECSHFYNNHLCHYNKDELISLINNMDSSVPSSGFESFLPSEQRRAFFVKLIDSRIQYFINYILRK